MTHQVGLFNCTDGYLCWLFIQGWLAAPLTYLLPCFDFRLVPRDSNPGWGDWRRSFVVCWVGFFLWFGLWAIFKSVRFAFLATGLDAVQRLEPKKKLSLCVMDLYGSCHELACRSSLFELWVWVFSAVFVCCFAG